MNGAGQERFFSINLKSMNSAHIVILTYDVTSNSSMDGLIDRYKSIMEEFSNDKIYAICGNKIDLEDKIIVGEEERMRQFKENNLDYYCRTSCVTFEGIEDMFYNLTDIYLKKYKDEPKKEEEKKIIKKRKKKDCIIF